jgi:RNA methyltransferase, TrmH family
MRIENRICADFIEMWLSHFHWDALGSRINWFRPYLCVVEQVSKAKQSIFRRLADKKFRLESGLCVAEGLKCIEECIKMGWNPEWVAVDSLQAERIEGWGRNRFPVYLLPESGLSFLENPMGVVAVFPIPKPAPLPISGPVVVLDGLQDPGNLGTILRTCHWFGIPDVFLLKGTVDPFSPKAMQSSMGSIAAVNVHRLDLDLLSDWMSSTGVELWVAQVDGISVLEMPKVPNRTLGWIIGNEGNGVRPEVADLGKSVSVPFFSVKLPPESLNAATALAVLLGQHFLAKD